MEDPDADFFECLQVILWGLLVVAIFAGSPCLAWSAITGLIVFHLAI